MSADNPSDAAHRFTLMSLIPHAADKSVHQRYEQIADIAQFAERLGFDGFGVGERHDAPYLSSSPAVLLAYIAARTSKIRLFTAASTIAMHDPVRAYEDYATLDQLSDGRLQLIIGTGLGPTAQNLFGVAPEEQTDTTVAAYKLLRDLWNNQVATYGGPLRPALDGVELSPRPRQPRIPAWHAGLSSRESAERPAAWGEPLVSGNLIGTIDDVAGHVAVYRQEWAAHGHAPEDAQVGVGVAGVHVAVTSQQAIEEFRPAFTAQMEQFAKLRGQAPFGDFDTYLREGTALVGSPAQVREKFEYLRERCGHQLTYHHADSPGMDEQTWRIGKELFAEHLIG
ncbi:MAG: LLM class flavin-dependent oxidoreductase [Cumulibacter sp.]